MEPALDDEALAARALARGFVTAAGLQDARRRLEVLRRAGLPCRLLDALPGLTPAQCAELGAASASSASSADGPTLAPAAGPAPAPGPAFAPAPAPAPLRAPAPAPAARALPRGVGPGDRVGPYVVGRELGRGGMGAVFVAEHALLRRQVALKVRLPTLGASDRAAQRFVVEAQASARLRHPNVVTVHDAGAEGGRPWIAMDLVDGESLDRRLAREGTLPVHEVVAIGAAVARALEHAHAQGVLHRDLKPANVLVRRADGAPLVTDFGLAKVVDGAESLTRTGEVLGTPSYMSPEQAAGHALDARADVWALGATLYHLLVGRPPFQGAGLLGTLAAVLKASVEAPRSVRGDVPAALEAVVLRCMERDLERRYPGAAAVAEDLERLARGAVPEAQLLAARRRRVRASLLALAAAGVLVALALAGAAVRSLLSRSPPASPAGGATGGAASSGDAGSPPEAPLATSTAPPRATPPAPEEVDPPPDEGGSRAVAPGAPYARKGVWTRTALTGKGPPGRYCGPLAYDARRREVLLLGGRGRNTTLGDLWSWDGAAWRPVQTTGPAPEARYGHGLAYDEARDRLVVSGGTLPASQRRAEFDAVWELDGDRAWTKLAPQGGGPGKRCMHGFVYDPARRRSVLFGGNDATADLRADLWAWDGRSWTALPAGPTPGPSGRRLAAVAWDARRDVLVVVGGEGDAGADDPWAWSPDRGWLRLTPPDGPGPRLGAALAAGDGALFLFGGGRGLEARDVANDTWRWDGTAWASLTPDVHPDVLPRARRYHGLAWDRHRGVLVLFGGNEPDSPTRSDTWEYAPE